jgi:hypothetical protein
LFDYTANEDKSKELIASSLPFFNEEKLGYRSSNSGCSPSIGQDTR